VTPIWGSILPGRNVHNGDTSANTINAVSASPDLVINFINKLKYPLQIGSTLYPKGTVVEVLMHNDKRITNVFPNMQHNPESTQVAIMLPGREKPTIHVAKGNE
jgi:hypothetical protein